MELKELKTMSEAELHRLLATTREKLRELRFKDASHHLKDVREIREVRTTIAQILTLLNLPKESEEK
jgi:ribosomal protein L29